MYEKKNSDHQIIKWEEKMPRKRRVTQQSLPNNFIWERVKYVQSFYELEVTEMARIAGYERSAWHRILTGNNPPNLLALYNLSQHFRLSMNFWFPEDFLVSDPLPGPSRKGCVCEDAAPLSQKILAQLNKIGAFEKATFLKVISKPHAAVLLQVLSDIEEDKIPAIVDALRKVYKNV